MPLVDANRIADLSYDQLQNVSLNTPGTALEPAGLSDRERVRLINNENSGLRRQLQQLQGQLTQQHLAQVRHTPPLVPGRRCAKPPPPPPPPPPMSCLYLYTCTTHVGDLHSSSKTMQVYKYKLSSCILQCRLPCRMPLMSWFSVQRRQRLILIKQLPCCAMRCHKALPTMLPCSNFRSCMHSSRSTVEWQWQ